MNKLNNKKVYIFIAIYVILDSIAFMAISYIEPEIIIHSPVDELIPFCEYFVVPYVMWYLLFAGGLVLFAIKDRKIFWQLFVAMIVASTICNIFYLFYPNAVGFVQATTNENIFSKIVDIIYAADNPTNACPSLHVLTSVLVGGFTLVSPYFKKHRISQMGIVVLAILICLSTVFIKQHSVIDVLWGMAVATIIFALVRMVFTRKIKFIPLLLAIITLGCAVWVTDEFLVTRSPEAEKAIKSEIVKYNQEANKDGITIIDMKDEPYFMKKQDGYVYNQANTITYKSDVTGTKRHAKVLLPPRYDETKKYPVLYMLHGLGGSHNTWIRKDADIILQNLMYFEGVPKMIVVFPNSEVNKEENGDHLDFGEKVKIYDKTRDDLINNLKPYIESHYPVKTGRNNTAIAGNSMGGRNTLYTAFSYPEMFGYVGAFSSAHVLGNIHETGIMPALLEDFKIDEQIGDFKSLMICVGRQDDVCGGESYGIKERLEIDDIRHIFYDTEGGHQNVVWQNALYNFGKKLFK